MTGGCGSWDRLGPRPDALEVHVAAVVVRPRPAVQIAFIASIRSRITPKRRPGSVPWSIISSRFQPAPTPNRNLPPESRSTDATSLAVMIGSRWITRQMPVPILSRSVATAAAVSATNGS